MAERTDSDGQKSNIRSQAIPDWNEWTRIEANIVVGAGLTFARLARHETGWVGQCWIWQAIFAICPTKTGFQNPFNGSKKADRTCNISASQRDLSTPFCENRQFWSVDRFPPVASLHAPIRHTAFGVVFCAAPSISCFILSTCFCMARLVA
jgi:hypothetical protein